MSNWSALGFDQPAPADDVVRFLGEENRGTPVAIGLLRMIANYNETQWSTAGDWSFESGINADTLGADTPAIVPPAERPQPQQELTGGVYDAVGLEPSDDAVIVEDYAPNYED